MSGGIGQAARRFARSALQKRGYTVRRALPPREDPAYGSLEPEFFDLYERCAYYTITGVERMYALYQSVRHLVQSGVPGDLVECGVWRGGSAMLMALTLEQLGERDRPIWLYDTFEGMTEPGQLDVRYDGTGAREILAAGAALLPPGEEQPPLEFVREAMGGTGYPSDKLVFVRGRVEETIPDQAPRRIALLRLDTDWYESTYHELTHLYPRLSPNGVLIVDDYGHWAGAKAATDRYFAERGSRPLLLPVDYTARVALKTEHD
jgi:O-methyltransferase